MGIKLVLFDLWKTLAHRDCGYSTMSKMLEKSGLNMKKEQFAIIFEGVIQTRIWASEEEAYKEFCNKLGVDKNYAKDFMGIRHNAEKKVRLYGFAIPLLENLKKNGYKTGIASNSTHSSIVQIKKRTGLFKRIDYPVFSFDVGAPKPDKAIYREIIKISGFDPGEIVMIGDDQKNDVKTPREMGMKAIHFENYVKLKNDLRGFGIKIE